MKITVDEINTRNINNVNKCDNEFIIELKLVVHLENDLIHYTTMQVPLTKQRCKAPCFRRGDIRRKP